jgi:hypothetical protein
VGGSIERIYNRVYREDQKRTMDRGNNGRREIEKMDKRVRDNTV